MKALRARSLKGAFPGRSTVSTVAQIAEVKDVGQDVTALASANTRSIEHLPAESLTDIILRIQQLVSQVRGYIVALERQGLRYEATRYDGGPLRTLIDAHARLSAHYELLRTQAPASPPRRSSLDLTTCMAHLSTTTRRLAQYNELVAAPLFRKEFAHTHITSPGMDVKKKVLQISNTLAERADTVLALADALRL
ncbi:hypothetical protein PYCC9005_004738 [Savitreella phatthalungensis]